MTIERFGYPVTLGLDAAIGLVGVAILPYIHIGTLTRHDVGEPLRTTV